MLPVDLRSAEDEALAALISALAESPQGRWTLELRFEGLRILPVALRLADQLPRGGRDLRLLFPDAGAAALARRDGGELASCIASFADQRRRQEQAASEGILLLVCPSQAEYNDVEAVCDNHRGAVVLINPTLVDAAVGVGSVARQRRRGFLSRWQAAYALIPELDRALRRAHPGPWELYRLDPDGFRPCATFEQRPDAEQQLQGLNLQGGAALGANLRALDNLLDGLRG
ncbi:MAG: DUF1995 family protein [Synechococcaceae cyanobacterium]